VLKLHPHLSPYTSARPLVNWLSLIISASAQFLEEQDQVCRRRSHRYRRHLTQQRCVLYLTTPLLPSSPFMIGACKRAPFGGTTRGILITETSGAEAGEVIKDSVSSVWIRSCASLFLCGASTTINPIFVSVICREQRLTSELEPTIQYVEAFHWVCLKPLLRLSHLLIPFKWPSMAHRGSYSASEV
jgi:hypothetical protein